CGELIRFKDGQLQVGDNPIIAYIEGDGIGKDIWPVAKRVIDTFVCKAYDGQKKIHWYELLAGAKALEKTGEYLPQQTIDGLEYFKVAIKGPLTTPVGGGIRSINVTLRQTLDLYACIRPVRYFKGIPAPVIEPEKLDVTIFRENTEDVYAGIEYAKETDESKQIIDFFNENFNTCIREDSGVGLKPISEFASKRIVKKALEYAIEHKKPSVTIVHKGNIMKYTEGAFRNWAYEIAKEDYEDFIITEKEFKENGNILPEGKVVLKDRIADAMFQELLLNPANYDVIVTTNLNGDYLSDAAAAQVGGLGIAPGANLSDEIALFEATHGTAPTIAGEDKANPTSLLLSGVMMLEYLGWFEAAELLVNTINKTINDKKVTEDIRISGIKPVTCSKYAEKLINNLF
ncbi:MAG: isocitrate dehydrogenase (NADP(+)), partial [Vampirovibrionia bacterium]